MAPDPGTGAHDRTGADEKRPAPSSRPFPFGHGPAVDYFLSVLIPRIGIESEAAFVAKSVAIASMV